MGTDRSLNYSVLGGALTTVVAWIMRENGIEVPGEVQAAITTVVMGVISWLVPVKAEVTTTKAP